MNASNALKISKATVRILIGLLFVLSAVSKLLAIDNFEVYIYSFNIFSYLMTTVLSRFLIATELVLGFGMIFKIHYKLTWIVSMLLMVFFVFFLVYVIEFRNDDNCNCFGDMVKLDPKQSIYKNFVIIAMLFFAGRCADYNYKPVLKKWLTVIFVAIALIVPYIVVPNDLIYNKIFSEDNDFNTIAFNSSLNDSTYYGYLKVIPEKLNDSIVFDDESRKMDVDNGRYIINYVLAGCQYCRMGAERLTIMFDKHGISHEKLKFVIGGNDVPMSRFITLTDTYDYEHWRISQHSMMSITYGRFPLYVFVENGKMVKAADFRHLDEKEITDFLK